MIEIFHHLREGRRAGDTAEIDEELSRLSSDAMRHVPDLGTIFNFYP